MTVTTQRIKKRRLRRENALETLVDIVAIASLTLGSLVAIGLLLTFSWWGLVGSIFAAIGAFLTWLLLRCLAEHLRLQKKIAGCDFEGSITGTIEETIWACGNCGQMLHSDVRCDSCGAKIVSDNN